MKKFIIALGLVLQFLLPTTSIPSEVPDEQLAGIAAPTYAPGGYSGVYFDDQKTLQRAFYYVESGPADTSRLRTYVTCESALEEPCKSDEFLSFETPLDPCLTRPLNDCVISLASGKEGSSLVAGQFVETITARITDYGPGQKNRYFTPFTGDPTRGIPNSGYPSIWKMSNMPHQGGDEYLVIAKLNAERFDTKGNRPVNLDVGVFPISRVAGSQEECFFNTATECLKRWPFPENIELEIALKTKSKLIGWFYGRLTSPLISSERDASGITQLKIKGAPVVVPIVAAWSKNNDLPKTLNELIQREFEAREKQFAGVCYAGCSSLDRSEQVVVDERNPSFSLNSDYFQRYLLWLEVVKDKAYANKSTWSFRSLQDYSQYEKCIASTGVAGLVTTNSNAYIATPPVFQDNELLYKVASPHFDSKGKVQIGSYDLAIRSDVARCIYGFTNAPINATLSVLYENGVAVNATTSVGEKDGWFYLAAKGFTYSSPTVKVKVTQPAPQPSVTATPQPSPSASASPSPTPSKQTSVNVSAKKKAITCTKGALSKKVVAVNPKCPKGYKKA